MAHALLECFWRRDIVTCISGTSTTTTVLQTPSFDVQAQGSGCLSTLISVVSLPGGHLSLSILMLESIGMLRLLNSMSSRVQQALRDARSNVGAYALPRTGLELGLHPEGLKLLRY